MKPHEHVILEIARERERQVNGEGWALDHDDKHVDGAIARAAASYAYYAGIPSVTRQVDTYPYNGKVCPTDVVVIRRAWPWSWTWWKPTTPRRDLIKAAALIVAEIERLDRLSSMEAKP